MKRSSMMLPLSLSAIALLGGAVGYGVGNLTGGSAEVSRAEDSRGGRAVRGGEETGAEDPGRRQASKLPAIPHKKSDDTVESLLTLDPDTAYGRVAAWLVDASEEDIAAYWAGYKGGKRTNDMTDLIMLNWTRANPQGAIAAVAGTDDEHYAWWAWAAHDPKKALAEAIGNNPDRVNNVTWGIGEFHPEWLRENFDKLPENARGNALAGMRKWTDRQDPEGSLDFMKKHDHGFDKDTFLSLVRKDPWAAQDWLKRNPSHADARFSGEQSVTGLMMETIAAERPADMERMVAATPPGQMRRQMEQVVFQQMVADDPEAALELARKGEVPLLKVEQLSLVGISMVPKDPDQAFALAGEMIKAGGGKTGYENRVEYQNGSSSWGGSEQKADSLLAALYVKDPGRTLDLLESGEGADPPPAFSSLVARWAEEDLSSLSEWANRQSDTRSRDFAAAQISNGLVRQGQYEEAMEWAGSMNERFRNGVFSHSLDQWARADRDAAAAWVRASDLPEQQKEKHLDRMEVMNP